jgi:YD repeat-containing protein
MILYTVSDKPPPNKSIYCQCISLLFLLQLLLLPSTGQCEDEINPEPLLKFETCWTEIQENLGGIQLDGLPSLQYSLGESNDLKLMGLNLELVHNIAVDAYGRPRSVWHITNLRSSLSPGDRGSLVWKPLTGGDIKFDRKRIKAKLTKSDDGNWYIRKLVSGDYEIRSLDGRTWRYKKGVLASGGHPVLGTLSFTTLGAKVCSIKSFHESPSKSLLDVRYDAEAQPIQLRIGSNEANTIRWDEAGYLISWEGAEGKTVTFTYNNGLLASVTESGRPTSYFTWAENKGYDRWGALWRAPVHLSSDHDSSYEYKLRHKGFIIHRIQKSSDKEIVTVFNPRRKRLEQRTDEMEYIVTFCSQENNPMALHRIENGEGEVLEEYLYNDRELLEAVRQKGKPERRLVYDDSDRLMDLIQIKSP